LLPEFFNVRLTAWEEFGAGCFGSELDLLRGVLAKNLQCGVNRVSGIETGPDMLFARKHVQSLH
jgi:hypothetical protein